ncbi:VOC family protein [bacterium]|nr:VOC family protein [bacterium]MBU1064067.1 VOC family protein [bacterium]MBU1635047.1 VOC family protein [bacterium]MBU1874966.1 VOC family protein [bacterium]
MPVKFQHFGLTITDKADIREFYQDILGMEIQKEFTLNGELAEQIFQQDHDIQVVAGTIGNLSVELFLADEKPDSVWEHICFVSENRPALITACRAKKYPVTVIEREPFDIVFIKDKSGNLFEIKQG